MLISTWPSELPQYFLSEGFSRDKQNNLLRTTNASNDSFIDDVRILYTARSIFHSGTMILTNDELQIFEQFVLDTLSGGITRFTFKDPVHPTQDIIVRLNAPENNPLYKTQRADDSLDWVVSFRLEQLP